MLRGVMLLGCCALLNAAPLDDAGRAELFARIQEAERNRVTTGQFKGEWTYTRTPRARSEADIAQAVAAHRQQYADALRSGQTTNATLEQWAKANGLSSAAEAARSPNAAKFLDMEVEAAAKSYEKTLRDASAVRVQRAEVSYALRPDHSQRVDRRFVAGTVDGQADPAASGFSEALVLDARRFRNYSPEHNNLLVREGMASDHSIEYEVAGRPALWDAGRSVATSIFTANHIVSSEPVTEGGEAAIKVVFCDQLSGEAGNTHVVWYLPDKGYAVLRSEQYVNGNLLVTQSYGSFREVQPGVWYPLEQQYINYTAELKASIRARLAAGGIDAGVGRAAQQPDDHGVGDQPAAAERGGGGGGTAVAIVRPACARRHDGAGPDAGRCLGSPADVQCGGGRLGRGGGGGRGAGGEGDETECGERGGWGVDVFEPRCGVGRAGPRH
jgi:hypothetical protein